MAFTLSGTKLTLENLQAIIQNKPVLELSLEIQAKFKKSILPADEASAALVRNYLEMQTVGFGPHLSEDKVKLALIIGLQELVVSDAPNISFELLNRLLAFFNRDISPNIQTQSTPSGQNAQLLLSMVGIGKVKYLDYELNAADILDIFSWQPLQLTSKNVAQVFSKNIFPLAELGYNLINLNDLVKWLTYVGKVSAQISEAEPDLIENQITQFTVAVNFIQEAFEINLNQNFSPEETSLTLSKGLLTLNNNLNQILESIASFSVETFTNLISTSEPPATSGFTQALLLTQKLQCQINNALTKISENSSPEVTCNILISKLENALQFTEQLVALAFWSISQVGKVFNLASENITLAAYYHSDFYVPKELVLTQLDNILRFTRTHTAPTLT